MATAYLIMLLDVTAFPPVPISCNIYDAPPGDLAVTTPNRVVPVELIRMEHARTDFDWLSRQLRLLIANDSWLAWLRDMPFCSSIPHHELTSQQLDVRYQLEEATATRWMKAAEASRNEIERRMK